MSNIIFQQIHDNFKTYLEDTIGSATSMTNSFKESDFIDVKIEPTSIINGSYSLQLDNINSANQDLGSGIVDFSYDIRLQIAFELNTRSSKIDYNNAINDIEEIIRKRLLISTWTGTDIIQINFKNCNRFTQFSSEVLERFSFVEIVFNVIGRTNLNS